jgi:two-component system KDP operon response regulator KdpE
MRVVRPLSIVVTSESASRPTGGSSAAPRREGADQPLVVLADGEGGVVRIVQAELQEQGFRVQVAETGEDALRLADELQPAILVLGLRLPVVSGLDVMRRVHQRSNLPVILLSNDEDGAQKVRALDMGADDFVVKPFSPEELSARVRAVLRRTRSPKPGAVVRMDGVAVDLERHTVTRHGAAVRLTRTEWMLLEHLIANAGHVLMNRDLLEKVWGPEYTNDLQYLRVWISRLRRKLETNPATPRFIKTYAGIGYMLDLNEPSGA